MLLKRDNYPAAGRPSYPCTGILRDLASLRSGTVHSFQGSEADDAVLSNAQKAQGLFGEPRVPAERLVEWIADWVRRGGANLGKPTHFEVRDGKF